jgi:hypothetical protein
LTEATRKKVEREVGGRGIRERKVQKRAEKSRKEHVSAKEQEAQNSPPLLLLFSSLSVLGQVPGCKKG